MRPTLAYALFVALLASGCQKPPVACEPQLRMDDLVRGLPAPSDAYQLLVDERTQGRFACGLAIAKFAPDEESPAPTLRLVELKPAEQARWAERIRGLSALREVIFVTPIDARRDGQTPESLCAAAQRLGASLLLLHAPNAYGPNSAQVLGVLYDAATRRALATLHASAHFLDEAGEETSPDDRAGDQRDVDARFQAARAFENHALTCLRELIERDSPPSTTQPHRWQTDPAERWWIPHLLRSR